MSDEIKETEKESTCFCKSKWFRKFLTIALGTFVGVYSALCLFAALHKPPVTAPYGPAVRECPCKVMHHHHFNKGDRPMDFQTQNPRDRVERTPFETPRTEVNR